MVRETGLEPVRRNPHAPQTCASASSATLANALRYTRDALNLPLSTFILYKSGGGLSSPFANFPKKFFASDEKRTSAYLDCPHHLWYTISDTDTQGFDRRLSVRASSKAPEIPAYSLRLFSRPGKNPPGQNCAAPAGERFCDDFCCGQRRNIPIFRGGQCEKRAKNPPAGLRVRITYGILYKLKKLFQKRRVCYVRYRRIFRSNRIQA